MRIECWKPISFIISSVTHYALWHFDILNKFNSDRLNDLMNNLFTSSSTFIGFIFAIIAILVTITEHALIKAMRENGMYQQIMQHLRYLLYGFSITMLLSYVGSMLDGEHFVYILLFASWIFMYSIMMLVTDMFRRLTLTFMNLK